MHNVSITVNLLPSILAKVSSTRHSIVVVIQILLSLALYLAILVCDSRAWLHVVPRQPGCIHFVLGLSASWTHGRLTLTGQSQLHNIRITFCHYHLFLSYTYRDAV